MALTQEEQAILVRACQNNDIQSFGKLYEHFVEPIYNFIYYKTHHRETAEDLTSQTFFKALESIQSYDPHKGTFSSWIYRIARNSVIDHYRTRKTTTAIEDAWDIGESEHLTRDTHNRLELEKVSQYLAGLSSEQRDIVILRLWQELSFAEVAEIVGKSEASSKMMFTRTVKKIREDLGKAGMLLLASLIVVHSIWTI